MKTKELHRRFCGRILESYYDYANVTNLVYEALDFGMESIQIFPNMLPQAQAVLRGKRADLKTCAVIAYPHGTFTPEQKAFEIRDAVQCGADQLEFVLHTVNARSGEWDKVRDEFAACREAAGEKVLKAIVEVEYLTDEMLQRVCEIAIEEGLDRLCTSLGLYTKKQDGKDVLVGTTVRDVEKMKAFCGSRIQIAAMGGIDSPSKCRALLDAGADFICTEHAAAILRGWQEE